MSNTYKDIPWPKKDAELFKTYGGECWWLNAWLNVDDCNWSVYANGYKNAGDILVKSLAEDSSKINYLVYPIIFNYRHSIEIQLKMIFVYGNFLLDEKKDFPKKHKIDWLWQECREIIRKGWPDGPNEDLVATENIIKQFSKVDPESFAFRYPLDTKGNPSIKNKNLNYIDLKNFFEVINQVYNFLDAVNSAINNNLDIKGLLTERLP